MQRIRALAAECRMPLCYGGGVKSVEQVEKIIGIGVEKVAISSAAVENPELVARMADVVGSQSVVVVLDVRRSAAGAYEVWTHNGTRSTRKQPPNLPCIWKASGSVRSSSIPSTTTAL